MNKTNILLFLLWLSILLAFFLPSKKLCFEKDTNITFEPGIKIKCNGKVVINSVPRTIKFKVDFYEGQMLTPDIVTDLYSRKFDFKNFRCLRKLIKTRCDY